MMTYQKNIILFGIKSASDSKSVCNKEFLKTKRKSHGAKDTYIYDKKVDSNHTFLAETSLDSGLRKDRNYYLKVFLKVTHSHCYGAWMTNCFRQIHIFLFSNVSSVILRL